MSFSYPFRVFLKKSYCHAFTHGFNAHVQSKFAAVTKQIISKSTWASYVKYIFISQRQIEPTLRSTTRRPSLRQHTHTHIHSLEHSTTWDAPAQIKLDRTTTAMNRTLVDEMLFSLLIVPSLWFVYLHKNVGVTWTTFNSKPTHPDTRTTTVNSGRCHSSKTAACSV